MMWPTTYIGPYDRWTIVSGRWTIIDKGRTIIDRWWAIVDRCWPVIDGWCTVVNWRWSRLSVIRGVKKGIAQNGSSQAYGNAFPSVTLFRPCPSGRDHQGKTQDRCDHDHRELLVFHFFTPWFMCFKKLDTVPCKRFKERFKVEAQDRHRRGLDFH